MKINTKGLLKEIGTFDRSARLFLVATILDGTVFSAWNLFFNFYILGRGFDRGYLGLVNAMPSIGALIFGIPLGVLSDRIGRKPAMLLGVAVSVVSIAMEVTVLDPTLILFFAFLQGLGSTLYYLSQAPFMMKVSNEENRAMLFSLNWGLVTISGAVGSLFAGQLPAIFGQLLGVAPRSATAYQAVLVLSAFLSLLTLIPLGMIREPDEEGGDELTPQVRLPIWRIVLRPLTIRLALPNLVIGFGAAILIPYMNVFFVERFALSDQRLGVLFSLSALLTGVGTMVGPRLAVRLGGKIMAVVATQGASLLFLMVLGFSPYMLLAEISFLLRGALMNMAMPLYSAFVMEQTPARERGTVNSVVELSWRVGWAVGPYISGVVQESYGFTPLFLATGVLYAVSIGLTWVFFRGAELKRMGKMRVEVKGD
jgi:MFS family permease